MKLELKPDGYEKIEAGIQEIENLASGGVFDSRDAQPRFQRIASEARNLRQVLREVTVIDPTPAERGGAEAA